jgi:hypothetical protein
MFLVKFWILLFSLIILGLLGSRLTLIPPRHVLITRNLLNGELSAIAPGLRFIPFHCEKYVLLDCRPIAVEAVTIPIITKDNQEVNVDVYGIYFIDGLEREEDKLKFDIEEKVRRPRAIRAVRKLTKIKEPEEELKKEITGIFSEVREAMVKKYLNMITIAELDKRKLEEIEIAPGKKREYVSEISPKYEGKEIGAADPGEKTEIDAIKVDLLAHLSWFISKEADGRLAEFGIGCDLRVLNTPPPHALVKARLEQNIVDAWTIKAEKEKKLQEVKASIIKEFVKETQISPSTFYLVDKGMDAIKEIASALAPPKEKKEGGEKK